MLYRVAITSIILLGLFYTPAQAQKNTPPGATIPIEVALIYQKEISKTPDFKTLAMATPAYINAPDFAKEAMLYREEEKFKKIYQDINDRTAVIVFDDFKISNFDRKKRQFSFKDFNFNTHYIYKYNGETYAVFIRNIDKYSNLPIKEKTSSYISAAATNNSFIAAELTLHPVMADEKPFTLDDGTQAHLILTDLVDIKLIRYESGKVIYHDIASEWQPKTRLDRLVKDIVPNSF